MIYLIRHGRTEANIKHIYCGSTDLPLSEAGIEKLRERREVPAVAELRVCAAGNDLSAYGDATEQCFASPISDATEQYFELPIYDVARRKVAFITSGMKRTEQTLELLFGDADFEPDDRVSESFCSSVEHSVDTRFREIDFGIFEMRSYYDLKDTSEYQEWISGDNEANVCPGGESGRQMEARVMEAFAELRELFLKAADSGVAADNKSADNDFTADNKSVDSSFDADSISAAACNDAHDSAADVVVVTHGGVIAAIMCNLFPEEDKTRFDWQPAPGCGYVIVNESEYREL